MYNNNSASNSYANPVAPKFIVNHLEDVTISANWKMAEDLADFGLSVELGPNERHLYAFFKQLKRNAQFVRRKLDGNRNDINSLSSENYNDGEYDDDAIS
jgi:hypothetical protein